MNELIAYINQLTPEQVAKLVNHIPELQKTIEEDGKEQK